MVSLGRKWPYPSAQVLALPGVFLEVAVRTACRPRELYRLGLSTVGFCLRVLLVSGRRG